MKKLLIVNLDLNADILVAAGIVEKYKNDGHSVSMLTLGSHSATAKSIEGLSNVYVIQLDEILKYKKHRIFSDFEMLRELTNNLAAVQSIEWDEVINISNTESAAYLVNTLKTKAIRGLRYTNNRTLFSENEIGAWGTSQSLMSERARIQDIAGISNQTLGGFVSNLNASENTTQSINEIGIEINPTTASNHLNQTILAEIIHSLTTLGYKPKVILTTGKNLEKFVYELNEKVSNTMDVIEINSSNSFSQLKSLNFILSTSLNTKTTAEMLGIKCLSVWTNLEDLYQNRSGVGSYNLFVNSDKLALLRGETIANTIISCSNNNHQELMRLPEGVELYLSKDEDILLPVSYHYNQKYFLNSILEKALWREIHFQSWQDLKKYLNMINDKDLSSFIGKEKDSLSMVAKSTLSGIRFLKNHTQGPNQVKELISTLDQLMNKRVEGATFYLLNLFKHRMDHLGATSKEDNILKTDMALITLKNHLGSLTKILGDMAEIINERRKVPFTKNYQTVSQ